MHSWTRRRGAALLALAALASLSAGACRAPNPANPAEVAVPAITAAPPSERAPQTPARTPAQAAADPRIRFPEGSGGVNQPEHLDAPYVVLLSLDGFRWDYQDLFHTPNLDRIAAAGVRADGLVPVFPVKTFPNHYAIATGMYVDAHGLVGNDFCEPAFDACYSLGNRAEVENARWYRGEPIWVTAETQGMVSASYFFVGSEAPVMGVQPTEWHRFDADVAYETRVARVLAWLALPPETRPHLVTFYFEETDTKGHDFGPDAPEMREAVDMVDRLIGDLLDGIAALPHGDQVHVVVVSDHGMGAFSAGQTYFLADLLELGEGVDVRGTGAHMLLYVDGDDARKDALRDRLAAVLPRASVYRVGEVPERLHYARGGARLGDIVIVPDFGWSVVPWSAAQRPGRDGRTHGWHRDTPEMQGIFLAMGPRIRRGERVPAFENVHVYPLIAEILGLDPNPAIDGRLEAVAGVLR